MKRHPAWLLLAALILGWLLDFLFWGQAPGINFALYALLCTAGGFWLLRLDGKALAAEALPLIPLIVFFAAMTSVRLEPLTLAIAVIFTLLLMTLLAVHALDGAWLGRTLLDHAAAFFRLALAMLIRPIAFNNEVREGIKESGRAPRRPGAWPVVRGVILAIPVLLIFGALLSSADVVFGDKIAQLFRLLRLENLPQYVFRLVYILSAAFALAGVFLHASGYGRKESSGSNAQARSWSFLGFTEASILMGGLLILFGAFVLIQFQYFFGGQTNIGVEGYTYSEYARRGFGELVVVAVFSLLLLLGLSTVTRRNSPLQQRLFKGLGVAIVALVLVMLVSAYQRLALYEAAYGFSRLRTFTNILLVWVGLMLAAVAVLQVLELERFFTAAALVASLGFGISLCLMNMDAFIVNQNVGRALHGQELDVAYLSSLSTDSVPVVAAMYRNPSFPGGIREAMGAVLACRLGLGANRENADWRSFHFSRWEADRSMQALKADLQLYTYSDQGWPPRVMASQTGTVYNCRASLP